MSSTIKVKDHPSLVRDVYSKAIINTDVSAYNAVCHRRNMQAKHEETITDLYAQIEEANIINDNLYNKIEELQLKMDALFAWKESTCEQSQMIIKPKSKQKSL